jgi:curved DNA-binding protein
LGSVDLKIPPNSKQGGKLRLTGRGLPTQVPGHFYVILQLVLPAADSEKAKALYQKMHDELDFNPRDPLKIP